MAETQEINLHVVDGKVFPVRKDVLCRHSDYFRAMFSGNYIEKEQHNITIDVVGADSMNIILRYMDLGSLDLTKCTVNEMRDLAKAANYLQITELMKEIEHWIDPQLTLSNCMEILETVEQCSYTKVEHLSAALCLLSFKSMKPEYIHTIERLVWYLSHPYLDTDNEIDVFKFGFDWMSVSQTEISGNALLILLGCLDVKRLTCKDLYQICLLTKDYKNSLVEGVINCLERLCMSGDISLETVTAKRSILCEEFTENVYKETYNIVKDCKQRMLKYAAVIQRIFGESDSMLFKYTEDIGMEDWLEVRNHLDLSSWSIAAWGNTKLVVCSVRMKYDAIYGTESFMTAVTIYDTLRKEWTSHGVKLPPVMLGSIAVVDDLLYIVRTCEPGQPSSQSPSSIAYNLNERTYKVIANSPGSKTLLHLCSHKGSLYAATIPNRLHVYESGHRDSWRQLPIDKGLYGRNEISCLISFGEYIYCCSDGHFIQRIRPDIDDSWELISLGREDISTITMCRLKSHLLVFLEERTSSELQINSFSEYKLVFDPTITYMSIASSCLLVLDLPSSLRNETSEYHQKYLSYWCDTSNAAGDSSKHNDSAIQDFDAL